MQKGFPKATCDLRDYIFVVSDGEKMGLARWADLCCDDPECGADWDEFDFKLITSPWFKIKYWYGPIFGPNFERITNIEVEKKNE
jgi:hypothetical protein